MNLAYETKLPLVEVGSVTAKDVYAAEISLAKLVTAWADRPTALGYSFLQGRIFQIDYPALKVRFFANSPFPAKLQSTPTRTVIPFRYDDEVLIDDVSINGQKVRAALDTGSSGTFALITGRYQGVGIGRRTSQGGGKNIGWL